MTYKKLLFKILIYLATAYFAALFTVVVPLHQHNDLKKHDDCSICAVACNPSISIASSIEYVSFLLLLTLTATYVFIKNLSKVDPNLRGPPIA